MRSIEITNTVISVQVRPFDKSLLKIHQKKFFGIFRTFWISECEYRVLGTCNNKKETTQISERMDKLAFIQSKYNDKQQKAQIHTELFHLY